MSEIKYHLHISEAPTFTGIGGCVKRVVHPSVTGSKTLGCSVSYLSPGEDFKEHRHHWEEAFYVVQGKALVTIEGCPEEIIAEPGMIIYIPGNAKHYTKNIGDEPVVLVCPVAPPPDGGVILTGDEP